MSLLDIERIMKENQKYADMLEEYDRTGHLSTEKIRRSFTLTRASYKKLKIQSKKTGKPMTLLLEDLIATL